MPGSPPGYPALLSCRCRLPLKDCRICRREQPEGYWQLTGSDASDTWQGDKFHGLESEYYPSYGENSLGANYTQYNMQFNDTAPQTVASSLNGTCSWDWDGGLSRIRLYPAPIIPST